MWGGVEQQGAAAWMHAGGLSSVAASPGSHGAAALLHVVPSGSHTSVPAGQHSQHMLTASLPSCASGPAVRGRPAAPCTAQTHDNEDAAMPV